MVYFKFLSEITGIGLRISFKASGVKFARWIKRFSSLGGEKYPQKTGTGADRRAGPLVLQATILPGGHWRSTQ